MLNFKHVTLTVYCCCLLIATRVFAADSVGNTCATATTLAIGSTISSAIDGTGDLDVYRIQPAQYGTLIVGSGGSTDTYGTLKNSFCGDIISNDDSNGTLNFQVSYNVTPGATYYLVVRHYSSTGTGPYTVSARLSASSTSDAGGSCGTAQDLAVNTSRNAAIDQPGDFDFYRIPVSQAGTLTVNSTGSTDTYGSILNSNCGLLVSNDDFNGTNFQVTTPVSPGTYYASVRHYSANATGAYTINTSLSASNNYVLYPLSSNLSATTNQVTLSNPFGAQVFGMTHTGIDIMRPIGSSVYSLGDRGVIQINNTNRNYGSQYLNYWNSFLVVYFPTLNRYVYYGHLSSNLAVGATVNRGQLLGTLRGAYSSSNVRTPSADHLHLGVKTNLITSGWGYTTAGTSVAALQQAGWLDPVAFMRGQ